MTAVKRESDFLQVYEHLPSHGWLSHPEAAHLHHLLKYVGLKKWNVLEVGCYQGRSTCMMAPFANLVFCVDPWEDGWSTGYSGAEINHRFKANLMDRGIFNTITYRSRIEDWLKPDEYQIQYAYLDGDHTYEGTKAQIEAALDCNVGWLSIHDVNDKGDGLAVKEAALEMLGKWEHRVERLATWKLGD
jgi:hypothetical protein